MPGRPQLTTGNRLNIMEILARCARCLDSGDLDGYVSNVAPNGTLFERHGGHLQIREYV